MLTGLLSLLALVAGVFIAVCALLYFAQDRSIFFPGPNDPALLQQYQANRVEIRTADATLEGWWVDNPDATNDGVVIYFGGNAEDVLYTAATASNLDARRMLVVNYRGYGRSTGKPGQKALYADALAIYDHAIGSGVRPDQVVVMGRSLGSGVASMLAGSRPLRAAVLITGFDSLAAVAAGHYPFMPVRLLLRHPFPSSDWAKRARAPALIIAAGNDFVVPSIHAQRLYEAWSGKKQIHVLAGMGHNDIDQHPDYYRLVNEFLADGATAGGSGH